MSKFDNPGDRQPRDMTWEDVASLLMAVMFILFGIVCAVGAVAIFAACGTTTPAV